MAGSVAVWVRIRRARRQKVDPDIIRGLGLPVPRAAQDQSRHLIGQRKWQEAITEIRKATGYSRRDARCIALALMYGCKVPTRMPRRPRTFNSRNSISSEG